jgi:ABC-type antimicrobial peptide transport system permease subunit
MLANAEDEESIMYDEGEGDVETDLLDYKLIKSELKLEKGSWTDSAYEVVVSEMNQDEMKIGKEISTKVNGKKLTVVGYYSDKEDRDMKLVNNTTVKYDLIKKSKNITLCPKDKEASLTALKAEKVNAKDAYAESKKKYKDDIWESVLSSLIMAGVVLAISFIEISLIIRASFLSRIKEVGVYRAIGVKKGDIYKMFTGEILAITSLTSLPGVLFMSFVLKKLSETTWFEDMFVMNPAVLIICIVVMYVTNLLFGLSPVWKVIRKPPAAILSRTDIN